MGEKKKTSVPLQCFPAGLAQCSLPTQAQMTSRINHLRERNMLPLSLPGGHPKNSDERNMKFHSVTTNISHVASSAYVCARTQASRAVVLIVPFRHVRNTSFCNYK